MLLDLECDGLLFDLDGVLVDSAEVILRHWRYFAAKHGLDLQEVLRFTSGRRSIETIRLVTPYLDIEAEAAEFNAAESIDTEGLSAFPGAVQLVQSIPADSWAVATSGPRPMAILRLTYTGIPLPPVLVTGTDVTNGKPHPEAYQQAAQRLGIAPERCVVVEDSPAGIQAGRTAGMRVIAIASTHSPVDLHAANVIAARLLDLNILPQQNGHQNGAAGRFTVRVKRLRARTAR